MHGTEEEEESFFLGSVTSDADPWTVERDIMDKNNTLKLDTGADVTVVSQVVFNSIFSNAQQPVLQKAEKPLFGPGRIPLDVSGFARLQLRGGANQTTENVHVVKHLSTPLLERPAIVALGLLIRVASIDMEALKTSYPKLCSGLGEVQQPYAIKLKPEAVPIPLPMMGKVKEELQHMESLGVISYVEESTDRCAGIVVVPRKDGKSVRLCVDLTGLNELCVP